jgi:hypothetical protein
LLAFEIQRAGENPATWEKKGSALYTTMNVTKYRELRQFTNRFLNHIEKCGGHVIYVGLHKQASVEEHKPRRLYLAVLKEMIKRLDQFFDLNKERSDFLMVMDEHSDRESLLTAASRAMFDRSGPRRRLIEPPFQVESHRYQTVQAADWICGLVGRLAAFERCPEEFADWEWTERYFGSRLRKVRVRSGIRGDKRLQATTLIGDAGLDVIL